MRRFTAFLLPALLGAACASGGPAPSAPPATDLPASASVVEPELEPDDAPAAEVIEADEPAAPVAVEPAPAAPAAKPAKPSKPSSPIPAPAPTPAPAPAPTPTPAPVPEDDIAVDDIPIPDDFDDEASTEITDDNLEAELAELEREIGN